jgi:hypothetical protein
MLTTLERIEEYKRGYELTILKIESLLENKENLDGSEISELKKLLENSKDNLSKLKYLHFVIMHPERGGITDISEISTFYGESLPKIKQRFSQGVYNFKKEAHKQGVNLKGISL